MSLKKPLEFETPEPRFHGDVTEKSHKTMSRIRGKDTSIEVRLRKALWHKGIRYRKNYKKIPGRPDIAITKYKIAVFVDGEFWHGYDWEKRKNDIKSNKEFWISKIERNMARDEEVNDYLTSHGWTVLRFWGKQIQKDAAGCADLIEEEVNRNG